ncbi:MAG TPA: hypothetical protein VFQ53_18040 [Kofleriaceae bacterium]|nr:hypothetical protein [Kofleriaceae bacterium]
MPRHLTILPFVLAAACARSEDRPAASAPPADPPPKTAPAPTESWVEVDPAQPLARTLADEAAAATRAGKKPHAYLHADWCPPCVEIGKTRDQPKMKAAFAGTHIIAIDVDRVDPKQVEAAGLKSSVLPIFYRLDDHGRPTGATIDGGAWGDNIPDNMAPPLAAFFAK